MDTRNDRKTEVDKIKITSLDMYVLSTNITQVSGEHAINNEREKKKTLKLKDRSQKHGENSADLAVSRKYRNKLLIVELEWDTTEGKGKETVGNNMKRELRRIRASGN